MEMIGERGEQEFGAIFQKYKNGGLKEKKDEKVRRNVGRVQKRGDET